MAKKFDDNYKYIDPEKKLLRTANNLYDYAITEMGRTKIVQEKYGLPTAVKFYKTISSELHKALLFGKAEAATALAYLYREGLGVEKNEYKDKLLVAVGAKLGDSTCLNIFKKDATRVYTDVLLEARQWVEAIKVIRTKYPDKDAEISVSVSVWADKQLESYCQQFHSEQGASNSAHNASYETCPDTSFESESGDVAMDGVSPHHYPDHH